MNTNQLKCRLTQAFTSRLHCTSVNTGPPTFCSMPEVQYRCLLQVSMAKYRYICLPVFFHHFACRESTNSTASFTDINF